EVAEAIDAPADEPAREHGEPEHVDRRVPEQHHGHAERRARARGGEPGSAEPSVALALEHVAEPERPPEPEGHREESASTQEVFGHERNLSPAAPIRKAEWNATAQS